jgi:hypothetical protein
LYPAQSLLNMLVKQLRVKASSHHRPGVKTKVSTKFIERQKSTLTGES